jgi:hypothetical protein
MCGKCAIHNTQYFSHDLRITGKQKSKLKGRLNTPYLMGSWGNTTSTSKAVLSAIHRAPQLGLADHD